MHHASHAERLELYRYCLALDSWCQARRALWQLRDLEAVKADPKDFTALFVRVAFYTLYGRPFKQKAPLKIEADIVPFEYHGLHRGALVLRDKMYAHSDRDLFSSQGHVLNSVTIDVKPRAIAFGSVTLKPLKASIAQYISLADSLIKTAEYRRNKIWKRWTRHLALPVGTHWSINIGTESDEVLRPTNKEPLIFSHSISSS